jgi:hypothetical protein
MSNPQLIGSEGERLTPREIESSELANSDEYPDDSDEEASEAVEPVEAVEEKLDRIPHQLFYPLMVALWISVLVIIYHPLSQIVRIPLVGNLYLDAHGGLSVNSLVTTVLSLLLSYLAGYMIYIPAAIFDRLFPTTTNLTMTQTYRKALKLAVRYIRKIDQSWLRRY